MSKEQSQMELLDRCVEDIRSGRRTFAQCLDNHPEARAELASLLPLLLAVEPPLVTLRTERKQALRREFAAALHAEATRRPRGAAWWSFTQLLRPALAACLVVIALVTAGGTAALAAQAAQPGDALYPLKLTLEEVQVVSASSTEDRALAQANRAATRLSELQLALDRGDQEAAQVAAAQYELQQQKIQHELERIPEARPRLLATIEPLLNRNEAQADRAESVASATGATGIAEQLERARSDRPTPSLPVAVETVAPTQTASPTETPVTGLPAFEATESATPEPLATTTNTAVPSATPFSANGASGNGQSRSPTTTPELRPLIGQPELEALEDLLEEIRNGSALPRSRFRSAEAHLENANRAVERGQLESASQQLDLLMTEFEALYRREEVAGADYARLYALYASTVTGWGEAPRPREVRPSPTSTSAVATPPPTQTEVPTPTRATPPGRVVDDEEPRGRGPDGDGPPGQQRQTEETPTGPTPTAQTEPNAEPTRQRGNSGGGPNSGDLDDRPGGGVTRPTATTTVTRSTPPRVPPGRAPSSPPGQERTN